MNNLLSCPKCNSGDLQLLPFRGSKRSQLNIMLFEQDIHHINQTPGPTWEKMGLRLETEYKPSAP